MYVVPVKNQQRKRKMLDDTDAKKCKSARASLIETPTRRGISGNLSNDSQNDCSPESESAFMQPLVPKLVLKMAPNPRKLFTQEQCTIDPTFTDVVNYLGSTPNGMKSTKGTKEIICSINFS